MVVIEERTKSTLKGKYSLSSEIWIFRNGQPDRERDSRIFVVMTSNLGAI